LQRLLAKENRKLEDCFEMKVRIKANRLEKADVAYLSLVERGANRSPFKVMKTDRSGGQAMIDLSRIMKADAGQAQIVGYVIQKADRSEGIEAALKSAGVAVDNVVEFEDGSMVYKQDNGTDLVADKGVFPIKMDDNLVLLVKGFDPYSVGEAMGFDEIIRSQGFMPGLSVAMDALGTAIRTKLASASSQEEALSGVDEALNQFHDYVASLANSIPTTAFKAFESFRKAKAEEDKAVAEMDEQEKAYFQTLKGADREAFLKASKEDRAKLISAKKQEPETPPPAEPAKKESDLTDEEKAFLESLPSKEEQEAFLKMTPEQRAEAMKSAKKTETAQPAADISAQIAAALDKAVAALGKSVAEAVAPVQKSVSDLSAKVDQAMAAANEAKTLAQKTEGRLKSTVLGVPAGDQETEERTTKSDGEGMGLIDTAFMSVRKNDQHAGARRPGFGFGRQQRRW
jgi:hypothetical protein